MNARHDTCLLYFHGSVHGPLHFCTVGNHSARPLFSGQEAEPLQDGPSSFGPQTPWRSV